MGNMIVPDNQIKTRRYNLIIDGDTVEEMLSPRMAKILANEYRGEGYRVDMIEVYSITKSYEVIDEMPSSKPMEYPRKEMGTPQVTKKKEQENRSKAHAKAEAIRARKRRASTGTYRSSYGRDRGSLLHQEYLNLLKRNGYRVFNNLNGQVWIGLQNEISSRIFNYIKNGGKKSDLDIKYIGKAA
jgi:hypothetical protein